MEKSHPISGARPNWYRDLATRSQGAYFGSLASLYPNEVFVTFDKKWIVTRTESGEVSVVQNVCLHAGMEILSVAGTQKKREIRCSGHQWLYDMRGNLQAAPKFCKFEAHLARPKFAIWNGYILGYSDEELGALEGFGLSLGLPQGFLSADQFWFGREIAYDMPYPCPLMGINYFDGLHVPKYHEMTFGPVVNADDYSWEFGPKDTSASYSIQLVRERPDARAYIERFVQSRKLELSDLGWSDFHLWLEDVMPSPVTPIDKTIFAVWPMIYGDGYVMPELYEGGRFLALSYLVSFEGDDGKMVNRNYVEYYVHKCVPERYRAEALDRFIVAYRQSADEDDELCLKLWAAHRRRDIGSARIVHSELEAGDEHFREWFERHFVE